MASRLNVSPRAAKVRLVLASSFFLPILRISRPDDLSSKLKDYSRWSTEFGDTGAELLRPPSEEVSMPADAFLTARGEIGFNMNYILVSG